MCITLTSNIWNSSNSTKPLHYHNWHVPRTNLSTNQRTSFESKAGVNHIDLSSQLIDNSIDIPQNRKQQYILTWTTGLLQNSEIKNGILFLILG